MSRLQGRMLVYSLALGLAGCAGASQGPEADLRAIATPTAAPEPVRVVIEPPTRPALAPGTFRAWVPRQVAPNGDSVDGHWMVISTTPPPVEILESVQPIPRVPHTPPAPKPTPAPAVPLSAPSPPAIVVPPSRPLPWGS